MKVTGPKAHSLYIHHPGWGFRGMRKLAGGMKMVEGGSRESLRLLVYE